MWGHVSNDLSGVTSDRRKIAWVQNFPRVKLEWTKSMWQLSCNFCLCSENYSYNRKITVFSRNVCASVVPPCAEVYGTKPSFLFFFFFFFSQLQSVWLRECLNAALWRQCWPMNHNMALEEYSVYLCSMTRMLEANDTHNPKHYLTACLMTILLTSEALLCCFRKQSFFSALLGFSRSSCSFLDHCLAVCLKHWV